MKDKYLYAVRDKSTGKLICDLTSRHKKYWEKRSSAIAAINNSYSYYKNFYWEDRFEIVTFKLVEVKTNE